MMSKPRVLVLENSIDVTGALKSILRSCLYLRKWYDFVFVLPSQSMAIELVVQQGFECHGIPMKEIRKDVFSFVVYFPALLLNCLRFAILLRQKRIDLVVSNDFYNLIPPCYSFLGGKIPYVCYVRFLPSRFPKPLVNLWYGLHRKFASGVIAVSEAVKKELPDQNNVTVIGNELPQMEDVMFVPSSSKRILYPANYIKGKGHELALESFSGICRNYPEWELRFVGGDMGLQKNKDYKDSLIKRAGQLGINDRIQWMGFRDDMDKQYQESSIVLNFSESESFSLTCLEAMFYGRAVIATDCGGPSEIIDHMETGMIVPVGDVVAMRQAMETLMTDSKYRKRLSENAYHSVRTKFSNQRIMSELSRIYQAALEKKTPNF